MHKDTKYWLALSLVNGLGDVLIESLFTRFNSAESIFNAPVEELTGVEGIGNKIVDAIYGFGDWDKVERELEKYKGSGFSFLPLNDHRYPKSLIQTYNPPPFLYMKGEMVPEDEVSIAIVGSRLPDRYGRVVTESISGELASLGVTVVSGMARGIDSIAQEEALRRGGRTIAVLGCGLDIVYPPENKKLYKEISEKGALLSEFLIGTPPLAQNFPRRNRIISGISLGVLVVQASEKSGSLISASFALDQNKEVFAVPGNIDRKLSRGTNWLLKKGAKLVETVDDILGEIEILKNLKNRESGEGPAAVLPLLSDNEKAVYSVLSSEAMHVDEIIKLTGLESSNVLSLLLSLELNGFVTQYPGKNFCRKI